MPNRQGNFPGSLPELAARRYLAERLTKIAVECVKPVAEQVRRRAGQRVDGAQNLVAARADGAPSAARRARRGGQHRDRRRSVRQSVPRRACLARNAATVVAATWRRTVAIERRPRWRHAGIHPVERLGQGDARNLPRPAGGSPLCSIARRQTKRAAGPVLSSRLAPGRSALTARSQHPGRAVEPPTAVRPSCRNAAVGAVLSCAVLLRWCYSRLVLLRLVLSSGWCYSGWCYSGWCYSGWCYSGWCYSGWCYSGGATPAGATSGWCYSGWCYFRRCYSAVLLPIAASTEKAHAEAQLPAVATAVPARTVRVAINNAPMPATATAPMAPGVRMHVQRKQVTYPTQYGDDQKDGHPPIPPSGRSCYPGSPQALDQRRPVAPGPSLIWSVSRPGGLAGIARSLPGQPRTGQRCASASDTNSSHFTGHRAYSPD